MKKLPKTWLTVWAFLVLLAIWHFLDVRNGARTYGDQWLMVWYGILILAIVLGTAAAYGVFLNQGGKVKKPLEQIYPVVGFFLGMLYLFVLPPLSAPDEISHYIGSYRISNYMLGKQAVNSFGDVLIRGSDWFLEDIYGNYEYEEGEDHIWKGVGDIQEDKPWMILGHTVNEETYRLIHDVGLKGKATPQEERFLEQGIERVEKETAVSRYQAVATTPFAYVPQALGISLARVFHLGPLWLAYLGRLCNLVFFVAMTTLSMRRLPFGKEVLFGVALLPMTLHLSASYSYDVMILGCFFYFTAVCLDLAYKKEQVSTKDVVVLMVLMAVAGPCKMIYGVLIGLCLLIPVKKFGGWSRWGCAALAVAGAWILAMIVINSTVLVNLVGQEEPVVAWAGEAGYSVSFLLQNPRKLLQVLYNTVLWATETYHLTMIGTYLGSLDPMLDVPYLPVMLFTFCLIGLALKKPKEELIVTGGKRAWIFTVCAGCVAAAFLSMLIAWTPVSSPVISGVQGRYFLPFLPVFLMACKNNGLILTKDINRSILYLMFCTNGYILFRLFSIISMRG